MEIVQPIPTRAKIARAWLEHAHSFDRCVGFPRKRGFRSYDVWLSLNGSRKEITVNSRNGGLKVFEKQEF